MFNQPATVVVVAVVVVVLAKITSNLNYLHHHHHRHPRLLSCYYLFHLDLSTSIESAQLWQANSANQTIIFQYFFSLLGSLVALIALIDAIQPASLSVGGWRCLSGWPRRPSKEIERIDAASATDNLH